MVREVEIGAECGDLAGCASEEDGEARFKRDFHLAIDSCDAGLYILGATKLGEAGFIGNANMLNRPIALIECRAEDLTPLREYLPREKRKDAAR